MVAQILLVGQDAPVLNHPSTEVITTYASGEVLVRTQAPTAEAGHAGGSQPHGLVLDGIDQAALAEAEAAPRSGSPEPFLAYVVLAGPVQAEWLEKLRSIGVEPLRFQPRSAYLAKAKGPAFDEAMHLDFVVRVVPLTADFKPAPALAEVGSEKVWIVIDSGADAQAVAARLAAIPDLEIEAQASPAAGLGRVPAEIEGGALRAVLALPFVLAVEKRLPVTPEDEVAGLILAGAYDRQGRPVGAYLDWLEEHGLSGRGVSIGIVDNGVDETHEAFAGRITTRDNGRAWHGTFVAGHAAGRYLTERDGDGFIYGLGVAPSAELISQDNSDAAADSCRETVTTAGPAGAPATIQNNSWGVGTQDPMDYGSLSRPLTTPWHATRRPATRWRGR